MSGTMKAVRLHEYGGPEVLIYEDAPVPVPADGEVLIRVQGAGVNPVDWKTRTGKRGAAPGLKDPFPLILGWDVSGTVRSAGRGASKFRDGDGVFGMVGFPDPGSCYADYVCASADDLALKPVSLTPLETAGIPIAGLTAYQALFDTAGLQEGQRVLINAAAGGVGHFAVQLAAWKGAYVIGTASKRNREFLEGLGVNEFVDYTEGPLEERVRDVDVVLDPVGGTTRESSLKALKKGGFLVSIVERDVHEKTEGLEVSARHMLVKRNSAQLEIIAGLIDKGIVKPHIHRVFPLSEAAEAHRLVFAGHVRGKVVLQPE